MAGDEVSVRRGLGREDVVDWRAEPDVFTLGSDDPSTNNDACWEVFEDFVRTCIDPEFHRPAR